MYNIIIAGSRDFNLYAIGFNVFKSFVYSKNICEKPTIICGMARGADMVGYSIAKRHNLPLKEFPADWKTFGRKAGIIRNEEMAKYAAENGNGVLLAFWDGESRGTKSMIDFAKKYKLEVHVFNFKGEELWTNE